MGDVASPQYPQAPQPQPNSNVLLSDPSRPIGLLSQLQDYRLKQQQFGALAEQPQAAVELRRRPGVEPRPQQAADRLAVVADGHGFQPLVRGGLGVIAGVANHFDQGSYAPGVSMVFLWGAGVRIPVARNSDIRIDANYMIHQVRYPNAFRFATASDTIAVRPTGSMTPLTVDRAITASWTWGVFR